MKRTPFFVGAAAAGLFVFVYLPILVVAFGSFNRSAHGVGWGGFTLKWYGVLIDDRMARSAVWNTFALATSSAAISTVLGSLLGYGMSRHQFKGKGLLDKILYLPLCMPDIVMAVALLLFFFAINRLTGLLDPGLGTMVCAHVTFQIPFVSMIVRARLEGLDPSLGEAAFDLGASPSQRFFYVTLPLMRPGVFAGGILAFTLSLDDFVVSFFTSGAGSTTLPILIYSSVKRGVTPEINALSTLIIAASILATTVVTVIQRKYALQSSPHAKAAIGSKID